MCSYNSSPSLRACSGPSKAGTGLTFAQCIIGAKEDSYAIQTNGCRATLYRYERSGSTACRTANSLLHQMSHAIDLLSRARAVLSVCEHRAGANP